MRLGVAIATLVAIAFPANAETIAARPSIIDGDTLQIHDERIRLLDVDAPESR
jgi:endonuclease YncB( thermonuclease family)